MNDDWLSTVQSHDAPVTTSNVCERPLAGATALNCSLARLSGQGSTANDGGGTTVVVERPGDSVPTQPAMSTVSEKQTGITDEERR